MANTVLQASGLASGIDTQSLINSLVTSESSGLTRMKQQQSAFTTQISALGDISSKLSALQTATDALKNGPLAVSAQSTNTGFTATPGSGALAGRYSVQVGTLAQAAKSRSQEFDSSDAQVKGGFLDLTVMDKTYGLNIDDGASLTDVASAINGLGAPISASVLNDGTHAYLSITTLQTGYPTDGSPSEAFSVTETPTGHLGQSLSMTVKQEAANAQLTVDGLTFTRQSNRVDDVIPGTTLALQSAGGAAEDLVMATDSSATQTQLKTFVDAYNSVIQAVQSQLAVNQDTDRSTSLAGDSAVRDLQTQLQSLVRTTISGSDVRSLADLGVKTARDGTLSIDSATLSAAISRNPAAVNALFTDATAGVATLTKSLVTDETDATTGVLTLDSQGLQNRVKSLTDDQAAEQTRLDSYRTMLVNQFTAMEQVISQLNSVKSFLTQQENASSSSSSK
jgi:flagellar hook-associated protein 2